MANVTINLAQVAGVWRQSTVYCLFENTLVHKLIDLHIRLQHLKRHSLHPKQFAYQAGKSTVSPLHHLVRKVENAIRNRQVTLAAFIDIEGAFDNTGFESIRAAAQRRQIESETVEWILAMLRCRIVTAQLGSDNHKNHKGMSPRWRSIASVVVVGY